MSLVRKLFVNILISWWLSSAWGYLTFLDSGEPTSRDDIVLGFAPQFILSQPSGSNGVFQLKTGITQSQDVLIQAGFGQIDAWATLATRWIPFPDYDRQPALGLRFDATLGREENQSFGILRLAPFVSKRVQVEVGQFEPYLYLPFGLSIQEGKYDQLTSLVAGAQIQLEDLRPVYFYTEMGFDVRNTFTYLCIGIFTTLQKP